MNLVYPITNEKGISSTDEKITSVIVFHLYVMHCKNMLVATNELFFNYNGLLNLIIMILMAALYIRLFLSSAIIHRASHSGGIVVIILVLVFYFFSWLNNPDLFSGNGVKYLRVSESLRTYLAYGLPLFVMGYCLQSPYLLLDKLKKHAWVVFVFASVSFVFSLSSKGTSDEYSMSFGYSVLPVCLISIIQFRDSKKKKYLLRVALCIAYIVAAGSRGPLVSIAFCASFFFIFRKKKMIQLLCLSVLIICLTIIIVFYRTLIIDFFASFFGKIGISSRTIWLLQNSKIMYDSGRSLIHKALIEALSSNRFWGLGAFASEVIIAQAHGLYIDIFVNLGYILGTIVLLWIFFMVIKNLTQTDDSSYYALIVFLTSSSLARGGFAGGLWIDKDFWLLLGLLLCSKHKKFKTIKQIT